MVGYTISVVVWIGDAVRIFEGVPVFRQIGCLIDGVGNQITIVVVIGTAILVSESVLILRKIWALIQASNDFIAVGIPRLAHDLAGTGCRMRRSLTTKSTVVGLGAIRAGAHCCR